MLLSLLLLGCPNPPPPPPPPVYSCLADPNWITTPHQPNEINETETFCDFYQFSWQWFLAQTTLAISFPGERVFETQRVYSKTFGENQCAQIKEGRQNALSVLAPRFLKPEDFEDTQADGKALYDQNGNILYYNIWYSPTNCNATDQGFQDGTMEIKVAWKVLDHLDPNYFSIETVDPNTNAPIYIGMVGFHMAIFTKKHPEMIWVTWEHKNNAPLCDGSSQVSEYNFASKNASSCLFENKSVEQCAEYNFNSANVNTDPPIKSIPNQVCRMFENGNQHGQSINGNDNAENIKVIKELNDQLVGEKGFLTLLPPDHSMKVWANYEMVGGLWTQNGADSGNAPIDTAKSVGDPNSLQRGSLELTNMTMETFEQGSKSSVPNCFSCHHYKSESPLTVSHIQKDLMPSQQPIIFNIGE